MSKPEKRWAAAYQIVEQLLKEATKEKWITQAAIAKHPLFLATGAPEWVIVQVTGQMGSQLGRLHVAGLDRVGFYYDSVFKAGKPRVAGEEDEGENQVQFLNRLTSQNQSKFSNGRFDRQQHTSAPTSGGQPQHGLPKSDHKGQGHFKTGGDKNWGKKEQYSSNRPQHHNQAGHHKRSPVAEKPQGQSKNLPSQTMAAAAALVEMPQAKQDPVKHVMTIDASTAPVQTPAIVDRPAVEALSVQASSPLLEQQPLAPTPALPVDHVELIPDPVAVIEPEAVRCEESQFQDIGLNHASNQVTRPAALGAVLKRNDEVAIASAFLPFPESYPYEFKIQIHGVKIKIESTRPLLQGRHSA